MNHPTYRIAHTTVFVTPVVEHWLEREIAQWVHSMKDRSDDPSHHEWRLYLWATSRSVAVGLSMLCVWCEWATGSRLCGFCHAQSFTYTQASLESVHDGDYFGDYFWDYLPYVAHWDCNGPVDNTWERILVFFFFCKTNSTVTVTWWWRTCDGWYIWSYICMLKRLLLHSVKYRSGIRKYITFISCENRLCFKNISSSWAGVPIAMFKVCSLSVGWRCGVWYI